MKHMSMTLDFSALNRPKKTCNSFRKSSINSVRKAIIYPWRSRAVYHCPHKSSLPAPSSKYRTRTQPWWPHSCPLTSAKSNRLSMRLTARWRRSSCSRHHSNLSNRLESGLAPSTSRLWRSSTAWRARVAGLCRLTFRCLRQCAPASPLSFLTVQCCISRQPAWQLTVVVRHRRFRRVAPNRHQLLTNSKALWISRRQPSPAQPLCGRRREPPSRALRSSNWPRIPPDTRTCCNRRCRGQEADAGCAYFTMHSCQLGAASLSMAHRCDSFSSCDDFCHWRLFLPRHQRWDSNCLRQQIATASPTWKTPWHKQQWIILYKSFTNLLSNSTFPSLLWLALRKSYDVSCFTEWNG